MSDTALLRATLSALVERLLGALPGGRNPAADELPPKLRQSRETLARDGRPIDWREEYREHVANRYVTDGNSIEDLT